MARQLPLSRSLATHADFTAIHEQHSARLLGSALRFVRRREIAEELTNEAWLMLYRNFGCVEPQHRVPWLFRVLRNLAMDYWRRRAVEERHSESLALCGVEGWGRGPWEEALLDSGTLKPEHRWCLTLRYIHGMRRGEIAECTGMTENQVKSCLQYGLELLRRSADFGGAEAPRGLKPAPH